MPTISCPHRSAEFRCGVASEIAGGDAFSNSQACEFCTQQPTPYAVNSVTVSLALSSRSTDRAAVAAIIERYGEFVQRAASQPPTWAQEAWSVAKALSWFAAGGFKTVPEPILAQRLNCCDACPNRDGHRCKICGCYIRAKTAMPAERCPLPVPLWGPYTVPTATATPATPVAPAPPRPPAQKLILRTNLCPGDLLTLSAAIESLHLSYPGEYATDVRTRHPAIWQHNPRITPIKDSERAVRVIDCHYPSINRCNQESIPFLAGYTEHLADQLRRPLRLRVNRPYLYLSTEELARPLSCLWPGAPDLQAIAKGRPIWIVNAGLKNDYTCKGWPVEYFQEVVTRTAHKICWVQIGLKKDKHPPLEDVVNLLDSGPPQRETILLVHRAAGGLGPVTFLQHLCAAWQKLYLCLVGGREPATWVQYPHQHTLHTVGRLDCCRDKSCWKARVVPLGDGDGKDKNLCAHPVVDGLIRPAPQCMVQIAPLEVLALLDRLA